MDLGELGVVSHAISALSICFLARSRDAFLGMAQSILACLHGAGLRTKPTDSKLLLSTACTRRVAADGLQPGDRLRFADRATNRGVGEAIAVSVDTSVKDEVKVTFDRKLPQLPASTIVSNNQGNERFVYRNNHQRGGRGHGLKFKGYGTLIENNVFENIAGIGIYLGCAEGAPRARSVDMATVRRNTITLCGWHSIEVGQVAAPSERIRIEDNVIHDSKTAGIFLLNVQGALVRGNTFESVTGFFAPGETYRSLILKDCTDVRVSGEVLKDNRVKANP
jgi:parallel beta-helix repeat protein